jgi:hypothetical protein
LELFVVKYLPTPELELFAAKLLIGTICVGIFTDTRVGIIYGGIFTDAKVGNIRDQIFIDARVRNIIIKPSF